jgi:calcineurin-like phosphoesterase family protein
MKPASGSVDTEVSLRGQGFGRSKPVKVKAGFRILAKTRTDRRGKFNVHFKIFERRRTPLRIVTISGPRRVSNYFRTGASPTEPQASEVALGRRTRLRWAPSRGAAQSVFGLRGSRFQGKRRIRVSFGGVPFNLGRTGRGGGFSRRLTVPPLALGNHPVVVRIGSTRLGFSYKMTADPLVAAAGDIACDPAEPAFNAGNGTADHCHMRQTSDLVLSARPDAVLALGDLQYNSATLPEFRASYEPTWGRFKSITRPTAGNHDYGTSGAADYYSYFGAAAGEPRKGYYSFNLGAWHIIALNSNCSEPGINCAVGFAQEGWLRADLDAHENRCVLAFWHHPMFSSGQHGNHPTMREFFNALYEKGADLVLVGHDHDYERFAPQAPDGTLDPVKGIRQFVVGTGGRDLQTLRRQRKPNSEVGQDDTYGILLLRLHPTSYDWQFVPEPGRGFRDAGKQGCH